MKGVLHLISNAAQVAIDEVFGPIINGPRELSRFEKAINAKDEAETKQISEFEEAIEAIENARRIEFVVHPNSRKEPIVLSVDLTKTKRLDTGIRFEGDVGLLKVKGYFNPLNGHGYVNRRK